MGALPFIPGLRHYFSTDGSVFGLDKQRRLLLSDTLAMKLISQGSDRRVYLWPDLFSELDLSYLAITGDSGFVNTDVSSVQRNIDSRNRVVISDGLYEGIFSPEQLLGIVELKDHIGVLPRNILLKKGPEISDYVKKHYSS